MSGFRMKGSVKRSTMLSVRGTISGGKYHGWFYCFVRFVFDDRENLQIELIGAEPDWPFPKTLRLSKTCFNRLDPIKGDRAKRIDTAPLIELAFTAHCEAMTALRGGPSGLGIKVAGLRRSFAAREAEAA